MSDDPETARQIAELAADSRPLLVLDVDDVLLDFIRPFPLFLDRRGYDLRLESFRLTGNISRRDSGEVLEQAAVTELLGEFFDNQAEWQEVTDGAAQAIESFGDRAEIILLTAMPHKHRAARRAHLDALGLPYPLLTTEMAKGPAIRSLRGKKARPVAFVDDQPRNLISVHESVPDAALFHLMADNRLRALMTPAPDSATIVDDWQEAGPKIAAALGIEQSSPPSAAGA